MATLRVTNLRGRSANIAPDLPDGVNITGVGTAGIGTFTTSVVVGSAVTANSDGVIVGGAVTATSLVYGSTDVSTELATKATTGKAIAMAMVFG